jgi:hypothetical protein
VLSMSMMWMRPSFESPGLSRTYSPMAISTKPSPSQSPRPAMA